MEAQEPNASANQNPLSEGEGASPGSPSIPPTSPAPSGRVGEVARLFLKLGLIAFGGPAAHVALMRDEVVRRRQWLTEQEFLDMLGVANLIPGPSSTELAIFLGYRRAGPIGLLLAGGLFIAPAMLLVLGLAWVYTRYGATPQAAWVLYGIKPVIIAVILQALWGLSRTAVKGPLLGLVGVAVLALYLLGINVVVLLFGSGLLLVAIRNARSLLPQPLLLPPLLGQVPTGLTDPASTPSLVAIFLEFLKLGAVVFGSGYVLLAFLRTDLVDGLHWLSDQQILDAVAVGQFTPGPVFTTATFLGYLLGGVPGALLATIAIFLPGFVLVAIAYPFVPRLRQSANASAFLDGVNVAAVGLMAGVSWDLGRVSLVDPLTVAIATGALALLIRLKINSAWLVAGGALIGIVAHLIR